MPFGNRLWLIKYDLNRMSSYISHVHQLLTVHLQQFEKETDDFAESLSEEDREDFYEYKSEEYQSLKTDIPRQLHLSFVASWYSFVEYELIQVCKATKAVATLRVQDQKDLGKGIYRAKNFLKYGKDYEIDTKHWTELVEINRLRNHIAHGNIQFSQFGNKPSKPNIKYTTVNINDEEYYVQIEEALYQYLRRHNMFVSESGFYIAPTYDYCEYLVSFGKELFQRLYADLKLK
nr:hypothetical protein [Oscillochloris trichoides]